MTEIEMITDPLERYSMRKKEIQEIEETATPVDQIYEANLGKQSSSISAQEMWAQGHNLELVKHVAPSIHELTSVPKTIKEQFWSVLGPGLSTSFNTDKEKIDFDLAFTGLRLTYNMNKPARYVNPNDLTHIENVSVEAYNNFKRSIGSKDNSTNLLKLIFTNIQQIISSSVTGTTNRGPGILERLKRPFG